MSAPLLPVVDNIVDAIHLRATFALAAEMARADVRVVYEWTGAPGHEAGLRLRTDDGEFDVVIQRADEPKERA